MKRYVLALLAFVALVGATVVYADGGDPAQIHACVAKGGDVRIVDAAQGCKSGEQAMHWNVQGPTGPKGDPGEPADPPPAPYAGGWLVYLEGQFAGRLDAGAVDGCGVDSDVVEVRSGTDTVTRKHPASIKYADCTLDVGARMSSAFWGWTSDFLAQTFTRKTVVLRRVPAGWNGGSGVQTTELELAFTLVRGVEIPTLKRVDTSGVALRVTVAPELVRRRAVTCCVSSEAMAPVTLFDPSTHSFSFVGSGAVNPGRMSGVAFELRLTESSVGEHRDSEREPSTLSIPNDIEVRVAPGSPGWTLLDTWFDDFVIRGNNSSSSERQATLELYAVGESSTKLTLQLGGVGIRRGDPAERVDDGLVRYGLYAETATFTGPS